MQLSKSTPFENYIANIKDSKKCLFAKQKKNLTNNLIVTIITTRANL